LHNLASDFSCADSLWKIRHENVPLASGSVLDQCRSKAVIVRMVEKKDRMRTASRQRKTPQARAHCGVLSKKMEEFCD